MSPTWACERDTSLGLTCSTPGPRPVDPCGHSAPGCPQRPRDRRSPTSSPHREPEGTAVTGNLRTRKRSYKVILSLSSTVWTTNFTNQKPCTLTKEYIYEIIRTNSDHSPNINQLFIVMEVCLRDRNTLFKNSELPASGPRIF